MFLTKDLQLGLFGEVDAFKRKQLKLVAELEKHLDNLKFLHGQIGFSEVPMVQSIKARNYIREAQFELAKVLVLLNIHYQIDQGKKANGKREKDFDWYFINYIKAGYGYYSASPMSQQDLYEGLYYALNRITTTLTAYRAIVQPFAAESVKAVEDNLKLARTALK